MDNSNINYDINHLQNLIIILKENIGYLWSSKSEEEFDTIVAEIKSLFSSPLEQFEIFNGKFETLTYPSGKDSPNNTIYLVSSVLNDQRIDRNYNADSPPNWFISDSENVKAEYGYYYKLAKFITYLNLFRSEEGRLHVHLFRPYIDFNGEKWKQFKSKLDTAYMGDDHVVYDAVGLLRNVGASKTDGEKTMYSDSIMMYSDSTKTHSDITITHSGMIVPVDKDTCIKGFNLEGYGHTKGRWINNTCFLKTPEEQCTEEGGMFNTSKKNCIIKTAKQLCKEEGGSFDTSTKNCIIKTAKQNCEEAGGSFDTSTKNCIIKTAKQRCEENGGNYDSSDKSCITKSSEEICQGDDEYYNSLSNLCYSSNLFNKLINNIVFSNYKYKTCKKRSLEFTLWAPVFGDNNSAYQKYGVNLNTCSEIIPIFGESKKYIGYGFYYERPEINSDNTIDIKERVDFDKIIEDIKKCKERFYVIHLKLSILGEASCGPDNCGHANYIIIDIKQNRMTRVEPHGIGSTFYPQNYLDCAVYEHIVKKINDSGGLNGENLIYTNIYNNINKIVSPNDSTQIQLMINETFDKFPSPQRVGSRNQDYLTGTCASWSAYITFLSILFPKFRITSLHEICATSNAGMRLATFLFRVYHINSGWEGDSNPKSKNDEIELFIKDVIEEYISIHGVDQKLCESGKMILSNETKPTKGKFIDGICKVKSNKQRRNNSPQKTFKKKSSNFKTGSGIRRNNRSKKRKNNYY